MMALLDVLGKITWVNQDFLSQGKISDILIQWAKNIIHVFITLLTTCTDTDRYTRVGGGVGLSSEHILPLFYFSHQLTLLRGDGVLLFLDGAIAIF